MFFVLSASKNINNYFSLQSFKDNIYYYYLYSIFKLDKYKPREQGFALKFLTSDMRNPPGLRQHTVADRENPLASFFS